MIVCPEYVKSHTRLYKYQFIVKMQNIFLLVFYAVQANDADRLLWLLEEGLPVSL